MGGAGKSMLLRHLAGWWQTTGLVDEVFYFGYDERAYPLAHLLDAIARQLLNRNVPAGAVVARDFALFLAMQPTLQATLLGRKLRSERHLLILDNLESVTGDPLAIPNTLTPAEQATLRGFLADLLDGQTLVLLGSRGNLDAQNQRLLLCIFPFTGVINTNPFIHYTLHVHFQSSISDLLISSPLNIIKIAQPWGLAAPYEFPGWIRIHQYCLIFLRHGWRRNCCYGRVFYRAGTAHYGLRRCDIPIADQRFTERLDGMVVLIDKKRCEIRTVYQNPKAWKEILNKPKWRQRCN